MRDMKSRMNVDQELRDKSQKELEDDLTSAKHNLLDVQHQLNMAEKVRINWQHTWCPIRSWTWVELTSIWMFHHLSQLPSRFCQIPFSPDRIGQTVEHSTFKSTQPSPRADGTPCSKLTKVGDIRSLVALPVNKFMWHVIGQNASQQKIYEICP